MTPPASGKVRLDAEALTCERREGGMKRGQWEMSEKRKGLLEGGLDEARSRLRRRPWETRERS